MASSSSLTRPLHVLMWNSNLFNSPNLFESLRAWTHPNGGNDKWGNPFIWPPWSWPLWMDGWLAGNTIRVHVTILNICLFAQNICISGFIARSDCKSKFGVRLWVRFFLCEARHNSPVSLHDFYPSSFMFLKQEPIFNSDEVNFQVDLLVWIAMVNG